MASIMPRIFSLLHCIKNYKICSAFVNKFDENGLNSVYGMGEYDDLDAFNGDTVHDMWVDCDSYENTGTPNVFDEDNLDGFIDNLND